MIQQSGVGPGICLFKTFPKDANVWDAQVETTTLACAPVTEGWVATPSPVGVLVPPPLLAVSEMSVDK